MAKKVGILIMAAGVSSRMGQPKQLLAWKETTLLEDTLTRALALEIPVMVVLGAHADMILKKVEFKTARTTINPDWERGLGKSIAHGLKAFLDLEADLDAILIMLGDQPLVHPPFLQKFLNKYREANIIATSYKNSLGVPALFDRSYFKDLLDLSGDRGAKDLLTANSEELTLIDGAGIIGDLDTPEDYKKMGGGNF